MVSLFRQQIRAAGILAASRLYMLAEGYTGRANPFKYDTSLNEDAYRFFLPAKAAELTLRRARRERGAQWQRV